MRENAINVKEKRVQKQTYTEEKLISSLLFSNDNFLIVNMKIMY